MGKRNSILALMVIFLLIVFVFGQNSAFAEDDIQELKAQVRALEKRVAELENMLRDQCRKSEKQETIISEQQKQIEHIDTHLLHKGLGVELAEGLKLGAGATFVLQGTVDANATGSKGEDVTDGSYSIDLELEKEFDDFGIAFIHLETGDGAGVEDELTLFSNVNRDADDSDNSVSLTEVWYEQYLFDKQLAVMFGKIDATILMDQNAFAHDETRQFLGRIFRNASTIQFPDNTAGVHGLLTPEQTPWLEIEGMVLDGDDDWEDIGDEVFAAGQVNFKPELIPDREGNYRFYTWYKDTPHIRWKDTSKMQEENYGLGVSIDQEITDVVGLFGRYGWQNPEVYVPGEDFSLEHSWSFGCQILGSPWGRDEDYLGLAIGMEMPSEDYKDAQNRNAKEEGHFEAYYACRLNEHLTVLPDFQLIWDPYGKDVSDRDDTIYILGTRAQVDF